MRFFLGFLTTSLLLLSSAAKAQDQSTRYKILRLKENGAVFIDTRSITSTFAGKYRTFWMITLAKDLDYISIDYFQSYTRVDCAARTFRVEELYAYKQGERDRIGRAEIFDAPIVPESGTEVAFEYACHGTVSSDISNMRLLNLSEIVELNEILHEGNE